jgi:hypothetical protein
MHAACMHVAACRCCHAAHAADIDLWQDELQLPGSCLEAAGPQTVSPLTHHCLQTLADSATVWRQPRYGRYMRTRRLRRKAKRRAREADGAPADDSVTRVMAEHPRRVQLCPCACRREGRLGCAHSAAAVGLCNRQGHVWKHRNAGMQPLPAGAQAAQAMPAALRRAPVWQCMHATIANAFSSLPPPPPPPHPLHTHTHKQHHHPTTPHKQARHNKQATASIQGFINKLRPVHPSPTQGCTGCNKLQ